MSDPHRLLIHVGYHKTATTWMQRQLFVPEHGYAQIAGHEEVFENIVRPHGLSFTPEAMHRHADAALAGLAAGMTPVISSELLVGNHLLGGRESDIYAQRLRQIFGDARIMITIRSQLKILPSVYMQYLSRGGTMPPAQFFSGEADLGYFAFDPGHFEYDRLLRLYRSLFGAENVLVVPQEALQADMDGVAQTIADFSGNARFGGLRDEARKVQSASYPEYAVPFLRRVNHVQRGTLNPAPVVRLGQTPFGLYRSVGYLSRRIPLAGALKSRKPVSDFVRTRFAGYYSASNARLREMLGPAVDLSRYD